MKKRTDRGEIAKSNFGIGIFYLSLIFKEISVFISFIFRPIPLLTLSSAIALLFFAQSQSGTARLIFEIIASVITSVAGGFTTSYFLDYKGDSFVIKKSIGAIRNLQLIKSKTKNINDRIKDLINKKNERDFEEISNLIENIYKDIINSIQDWSDVNPNYEAIVDYFEMIDGLQTKLRTLNKEKVGLELQKKNAEKGEDAIKTKLSEEIGNKDREIGELREKIFNLTRDNSNIINLGTVQRSSGASIYRAGDTGINSLSDFLSGDDPLRIK